MIYNKTFYYYKRNIIYNLLNKFVYKDITNLPKIKKLVINLLFNSNDFKKLATGLLALKLLTGKKGKLIKSKKPNLLLKIRKGQPIGCKVEIFNKNDQVFFLEKITRQILSKKMDKKKNYKKNLKKINSISFQVKNFIFLEDLERHYQIFNRLKNLNVNISLNTADKKECRYFLSCLKLKVLL